MLGTVIAFAALLVTVMGGLWKLSALIAKVQATVEHLGKGLEKNTALTQECAERIARLEGPEHPRYYTTNINRSGR